MRLLSLFLRKIIPFIASYFKLILLIPSHTVFIERNGYRGFGGDARGVVAKHDHVCRYRRRHFNRCRTALNFYTVVAFERIVDASHKERKILDLQIVFGMNTVIVLGNNGQLDLSCEELWENGVQVDTPFDGLLAFSDATELWGLNESTLRKAITYGKLVNGVDVCKFGKQWVVSVEAMTREYGNAGDRV